MSRPALVLITVAAVLLLSPLPTARAAELYELGAGGSYEGGSRGASLVGVHAGIDFAPASRAAVVARADFAAGDGERLQSFLLGARLGTVRGVVRPYVDAGLGIAPGSTGGGGFAAACGVGVRLVRSGPLGGFVHVRGLMLGNLEETGDLLEWRAGLAFAPRSPVDEAGRTR